MVGKVQLLSVFKNQIYNLEVLKTLFYFGFEIYRVATQL